MLRKDLITDVLNVVVVLTIVYYFSKSLYLLLGSRLKWLYC